ncbi:hypothetical protein QN277_015902 [Acacia crassicarpa]|uniref:DUF7054 domain-containing protein n=1 Tax=Acacia crassicarpa TaxID=499986 RepID=A0AAE1JZH2_9FABA|nr:hypothetical protein QN277_015902 [Acacia crassicarpa]
MVGKNSTDQQQKKKKKEEDDDKNKRSELTKLLITVNVAGSTGPLRLVVNENDIVSDVIHITLKSFARLGRLPLLLSDPNNFLLYSSLKLHALNPKEAIGCCGERNFILWKKEAKVDVKETRIPGKDDNQKQSCCWTSKRR